MSGLTKETVLPILLCAEKQKDDNMKAVALDFIKEFVGNVK
jgi:hypothetical protein